MDSKISSTEQHRIGLLVSVRNQNEAALVANRKVDIVDFKEPSGGSLGRVDVRELRSILDRSQLSRSLTTGPFPQQMSCALGEIVQQNVAELVDYVNQADQQRRLNFVKIGLAETARAVDWRRKWWQLKQELPTHVCLVPVAYADYDLCGCPSVEGVLGLAAEAAAKIVLIDTYLKNGNGLFDYLSPQQLVQIRDRAADNGTALVVAGSLRVSHIEKLRRLRPDYVAVRGAVCQAVDRVSDISGDAVDQFQELLAGGKNASHGGIMRAGKPAAGY